MPSLAQLFLDDEGFKDAHTTKSIRTLHPPFSHSSMFCRLVSGLR